MAIGNEIAQARTSKGLTQEQLAHKLYVTRQAVSRWETGESSPSIDMIKLIAVVLEVPITKLLEMPEQPVCQSCGMIMTADAEYGHEHDGSQSHDYCKWCYQDGTFAKPTRSLEEQIEVSAKGLVENMGYSLEEAVSLMGVALPTLKRWEAIQENERRFGAEARALYGDEVIDASQQKLLDMDLSEWTDLEQLDEEINRRLSEAMAGGDPSSLQAQAVCALHAKWIQGHWPDGIYSPDAHLSLAQGYLADPRFIAYYDNACGTGATEFLVRALEIYLIERA